MQVHLQASRISSCIKRKMFGRKKYSNSLPSWDSFSWYNIQVHIPHLGEFLNLDGQKLDLNTMCWTRMIQSESRMNLTGYVTNRGGTLIEEKNVTV